MDAEPAARRRQARSGVRGSLKDIHSPTRRVVVAIAAVATSSLLSAPPLRAQPRPEHKAQASFTTGASFGDGQTALALSAALASPFTSRLGLEVEIAYARKLDFTLNVCPPPLVCVRGGQIPVIGRTVSLIPQLAIRLLPRSYPLYLSAQGGVGAGHVRQRYFFGPPFSSPVGERTRSNLTLAFAFGGVAMMAISQRIAVGVDVRSLYLLDDPPTPERFITPAETLSTLRVGARVSWQF